MLGTRDFPGLDVDDDDDYDDNWGPLILMGMTTALNATVGLTKSTVDPFSPTEVPVISVLPPTPDTTPRNSNFEWDNGDLTSLPVGPTTPLDTTLQVSPMLFLLTGMIRNKWVDQHGQSHLR